MPMLLNYLILFHLFIYTLWNHLYVYVVELLDIIPYIYVCIMSMLIQLILTCVSYVVGCLYADVIR